jgi:dolichol-phosphate mannosyltransferase
MSESCPLSIVIPVFNEESVLPLLLERLTAVRERLPRGHEIIFVDDGSTDDSLLILERQASQDPQTKVLSFSRNFGHQAAVGAGLDLAHGAAVAILDADLQDPPELLIDMYKAFVEEGHELVLCRRSSRNEHSRLKVFLARFFYWFMRKSILKDLPSNVSEFRLMSARIVDVLRHMGEKNRFTRGMVTWAGFKPHFLVFERPPRASGDSKYSHLKSLHLALDAIFSFSSLPLRAAVAFNAFALAAGWGLLSLKIGSPNLFYGIVGFSQLSLWATLAGHLRLVADNTNKRPLYVISKTRNLKRAANTATKFSSGGLLLPATQSKSTLRRVA